MMGKKIKPYIGESCSSLAESPLGQTLKQLKEIIVIQIKEAQSSEDSKEKNYSLQQLTTFAEFLDAVEAVLSFYSEGRGPGHRDVIAFPAKVYHLYNQYQSISIFNTPAYAYYKVIQQDFESALKRSLKMLKIQQITEKDADTFRTQLKTQLLKSTFDEASKIPGCNLPDYHKVLEQVIDSFDFTQFNNQKSVRTADLIDSFLDAFFWSQSWQSEAPYSKQEFQITHPSVYQVIIEALILLEEVPQELAQLVSFLDPSVVINNILSTIIQKLFGVFVSHTPNEQSKFIFTLGQNKTIDLVEMYKPLGAAEFLLASISSYFNNYQNSPHVKSELAKSKLITQFIELEKQLDYAFLEENEETMKLLNLQVDEKLLVEDKVKTLIHWRKLFKSSCEQIDFFQQRKGSYEKGSVVSLISSHQVLARELNEAEFDLFAQEQGLPDFVISLNENAECRLLDVQQKLATIDLESVIATKTLFVEKISQLEKQLETLLPQWVEFELMRHSSQNQHYVEALQEMVIDADLIVRINKTPLPNDLDERIVFIEQEIQTLEQKQHELATVSQQLQILQETINNPVFGEEALVPYATDINNCYQEARGLAQSSLQQVQADANTLEQVKGWLSVELKKAQADKVLKETMESSDPSVIIALKEEKKKQNEGLQQTYQQHLEELREKEAQLADCNHRLSSNTLEKVEEEYTQLFTQLMQKFAIVKADLVKLDSNIENIFRKNSLETEEGLQTAIEWLTNFLAQPQKPAKEREDEIVLNTRFLSALRFTKQVIGDNKEDPFSMLDKTLADILNSEPPTKGFDLLLQMLNDSEHTKEIWDLYRKTKDNSGKAKLLVTIESRIESCSPQLASQIARHSLALKSDVLQFLANSLRSLQTLQNDKDRVKAQHESFKEEQHQLNAVINALNTKIVEESIELNNTEKRISVLDQIAELLKQNQSLNEKMNDLDRLILESTSVELLNENQKNLNESILHLKEHLGELTRYQLELKQAIADLSDKEIYQENLEKIECLLSEADYKITDAINRIVNPKLEVLQNQSTQAGATLSSIERMSQSLAPQFDLSNIEKLELANQLLQTMPDFDSNLQMSSTMRHLEADKILCSKKNPTIDQLAIQVNLILNNMAPVQDSLLAGVDTLLDSFAGELRSDSDSLAVNESKQFYETNTARLETLANAIDRFPYLQLEQLKGNLEQSQLEKTESLLGKIGLLRNSVEHLKGQIKIEEANNSKLAARIAQREELAARYTREFRNYILQRGEKYARRDKLFNRDAVTRANFTAGLNTVLESYVDQGNSQVIFDYLAQRGKPFAGFTLQPLINRLKLDIKALAKEDPRSHEEQVFKILRELEQINPDFAEGIRKLYKKIYLITDFSSSIENPGSNDNNDSLVVQGLAASLTEQVDLFLVSNQDLLKEQGNSEQKRELLADFKDEFICRLHSQDNLLSTYYSWGALVANIASAVVAVFTLGISAGITAAATKLITGRASIFYKPDGIHYANVAERAVEEVAQVVAPAA